MGTEVKEKPILFSTWSVQRILDEATPKVQTRRVLKVPNPETIKVEGGMIYHRPSTPQGEPIGPWYEWQPVTASPYGGSGDRIWIKETWQLLREWGYEEETGLEVWPKGRKIPKSFPNGWMLSYKADGMDEGPWRSSLFMPRWASRLLLEIDEVKVERLQDLSWDDALAEGIEEQPKESGWYHGPQSSWRSPISAFAEVWAEVGRGRSHKGYEWEANPWIWALTFHILERRDKNE